MGFKNALFASEKTGDLMKQVPHPIEETVQCTVTYLSVEGKTKQFSFKLDSDTIELFQRDGRKGMLFLLRGNPKLFEELSKNMIPIEFFFNRLEFAIKESDPKNRVLNVDLSDSELKVLQVSITTQDKLDFTSDFMKVMGSLLIGMSTGQVKEVEDRLAVSRYLEDRYGVNIVFGAGASLGGAMVKFQVKPGSKKEEQAADLLYEISDPLVEAMEKRILAVSDETLRFPLLYLFEQAVSNDNISALACISKFLDAYEGEKLSPKAVIDLAISLKQSFYSPIPTVKKSYGVDAAFVVSNPYDVPATSFLYSRETATSVKKYGVSYYPDSEGGNLAVILGLQDLYFSWNLVKVPEFLGFKNAKLDPLSSGMLVYGGLGIGFEGGNPFLSVQAYRLDLSLDKSGIGIKQFGFKVPGIYLGVLTGISAINVAVTYSSADFWEYAAQATLYTAVDVFNPYGPIDRLFTVFDLMMPEWFKDEVGMADFFERKTRVESYLKTGQYNKALQEIESMLDSDEKSVTRDPVLKYAIMMLEDRAIEMEIVHFGSSSPSRSIEERSEKAFKRLVELNQKMEKENGALSEKEWREYLGISTYLSSKFLIMRDPAKGIYIRVPSGFDQKDYEALSRELVLASENLSSHFSGSVRYSTLYYEDPVLALGLSTFSEVTRSINPEMFGKYVLALEKQKSSECNVDYLEFCLKVLSGYGRTYLTVRELDSRLWTVLETLRNGSNALLEESSSKNMEQKIYNSPVNHFITTSDPFGFYQTEYWMPLTSLFMWGKHDEDLNELVRSNPKVMMLAKAEKRLLQRLTKGLEKEILDYDFSFDLIPEETGSFDFSDEIDRKQISEKFSQLEEDYLDLEQKHAKLLKDIDIVSGRIESSKKELNQAIEELNADPASKEARQKVEKILRAMESDMALLASLLVSQTSLLGIQAAKAKYLFRNENDTEILEELQEQAVDDLNEFMESKTSFEEMQGKIARLMALSLATMKIDSAILADSVPKKKKGPVD